MSLFKTALDKLKKGLAKTRAGFVDGLRSALVGKTLNAELLSVFTSLIYVVKRMRRRFVLDWTTRWN